MKTVKKLDEILRVTDERADYLVKNQGYSYTPKQIWKTFVRDADKKQKEKS